jgi:hypothetical protein
MYEIEVPAPGPPGKTCDVETPFSPPQTVFPDSSGDTIFAIRAISRSIQVQAKPV